MNNNQSTPHNVSQYVMDTVMRSDVETVEQLIKEVQIKFSISQKEAQKYVFDLIRKNKLVLKRQSIVVSSLQDYILSANAHWYWIIMTIAFATVVFTFTISEHAYPMVYVRYLFGSLFVLVLPGYSLTKTLFPTKELDKIERAALSIGISIVLVTITSLLLNFTHWGIRILPLTIGLMALTTTLATTAIIREHRMLVPRR